MKISTLTLAHRLPAGGVQRCSAWKGRTLSAWPGDGPQGECSASRPLSTEMLKGEKKKIQSNKKVPVKPHPYRKESSYGVFQTSI